MKREESRKQEASVITDDTVSLLPAADCLELPFVHPITLCIDLGARAGRPYNTYKKRQRGLLRARKIKGGSGVPSLPAMVWLICRLS